MHYGYISFLNLLFTRHSSQKIDNGFWVKDSEYREYDNASKP